MWGCVASVCVGVSYLSLCSLGVWYYYDGVLQLCCQDRVSVAKREDGGAILENGFGREEASLHRVLCSH